MAITIYMKTEKMPTTTKLSSTGWAIIDTTINQPLRFQRKSTVNKSSLYHTAPQDFTRLYLHIEGASEPSGDGSILETDFNATGSQTDTEYSATGSPAWIKSFTSTTSFFDFDQNFGQSVTKWNIYYISKYANKTDSPYIRFYFYKRNNSNVYT